jgi:hypothetical protein
VVSVRLLDDFGELAGAGGRDVAGWPGAGGGLLLLVGAARFPAELEQEAEVVADGAVPGDPAVCRCDDVHLLLGKGRVRSAAGRGRGRRAGDHARRDVRLLRNEDARECSRASSAPPSGPQRQREGRLWRHRRRRRGPGRTDQPGRRRCAASRRAVPRARVSLRQSGRRQSAPGDVRRARCAQRRRARRRAGAAACCRWTRPRRRTTAPPCPELPPGVARVRVPLPCRGCA